jgi:hypothetical protein
MVIADNETRWNLIYISIRRAIQLFLKIQIFSVSFKEELNDDYLLSEDWEVLRRIE